MKKYLFAFFTLIYLPLGVHAAVSGTITLQPQFPRPQEVVTLTVSSYSFDVNNSTYEWNIDGVVRRKGVGEKTYSLTAQDAGRITRVLVGITTPKNEKVLLAAVIDPQSLDLVWESDEGYVPAFYEGKRLPGEGSRVRVVAFPTFVHSGKKVSPDDISYTWYINGKIRDAQSGRGKYTLRYTLDYLNPETKVRVVARDESGGVLEQTTSIRPSRVVPRLYQEDPVLGTRLEKALLTRFETTKEFSLRYVPFFMSETNTLSSGTYSWKLDASPLSSAEPTLLTLRPKESSYGSRNILITASHPTRRLQESGAALNVVFDTRK